MKLLKRFFNFYLDASIHVAFAICALLLISFQTFNIYTDYHLTFFLFFGSISCYNFIKYGVEAEKYFLVANQYHKSIQFFSIVTLLIALYHAHFLNYKVLIGVAVLICFAGLYALPVLPKSKNLRSWGGLKIFIVALVWSGATVVLPILSVNQEVVWDVGIEIFQRFLLVLILLVPFEVRDLAYDKIDLKTLPQRFGIAKTKFFGGIATLIFFFTTFLKDEISIEEQILKSAISIILAYVLFRTQRNQTKYFSSFWVEAIPILWYGLSLVLIHYIKY